jgi:hypothetical protein
MGLAVVTMAQNCGGSGRTASAAACAWSVNGQPVDAAWIAHRAHCHDELSGNATWDLFGRLDAAHRLVVAAAIGPAGRLRFSRPWTTCAPRASC